MFQRKLKFRPIEFWIRCLQETANVPPGKGLSQSGFYRISPVHASISLFVKAKTCFHIRSKHRKVRQNCKENSKLTVLTLQHDM